MSGLKKYEQIVKAITDGIVSGKYIPLGPIPSERALMMRFKTARDTVRKALSVLDAQRMIYRRPGRVTVVSDRVLKSRMKIGVMISGCTFTEIFRSICDAVKEFAALECVEVVVGDASEVSVGLDSESAVLAVAERLVARGIRGVIFQPVQFSKTSDETNRRIVSVFREAGIEVVLVDCDVVRKPDRSCFDLVDIDNFNAGRIAVKHAIDRGARKVVFVARAWSANTVVERAKGVKSGADSAEVKVLTLESTSDYRMIESALKGVGVFDTVICQNDIAAMNVMAVLKRMGMNVPKDVMVIGFDDVVMAGRSIPGLTSVHQPCRDIAEQAFRRLLARIDNPSASPLHIHCGESLVVRGSTERDWHKTH